MVKSGFQEGTWEEVVGPLGAVFRVDMDAGVGREGVRRGGEACVAILREFQKWAKSMKICNCVSG